MGARAEASIDGTLGDGLATGHAGVTGMAGFGAEGEISGHVGLHKVEFHVQGGIAVGLGGGVDLNVSIDPTQIAKTAGKAVLDKVTHPGDWF